jgi:hypothetical protein
LQNILNLLKRENVWKNEKLIDGLKLGYNRKIRKRGSNKQLILFFQILSTYSHPLRKFGVNLPLK